jgi:hypothetical protein
VKRVVIAAAIIVGAVLFSVLSAAFSAKESREIIILTQEIGALTEAYKLDGFQSAQSEAIRVAEKLERQTENYENAVSLFVRDDRLTALEYSIARLKHLIRYNADEVAAELENIREQVETIAEGERPYWYNIL